MMATPEHVFWEVVDDLNRGEGQPVERYLELVPSSDREELAQLLSMLFASRAPQSEFSQIDADSYARVFEAIDRVASEQGTAGVLPKALSELRRARGIKRQEIVELLASRFEVAPTARAMLERQYHLLETGRLAGRMISRRLLGALSEIFGTDVEDLISASEPGATQETLGQSVVFARTGPHRTGSSGSDISDQPQSPEEQVVERLFTGGRDA